MTFSSTSAPDEQVTATFAPAPKPTPSAPKCTLSSGGANVLLRAHKRTQRGSVGILRFGVRCDQAASVALSAVVKETVGRRHGKPVVQLFRLGPVHGSVRAGVSTALSLALPRGALSALAHHRPESLVAALVATNANGQAHADAAVTKLHGLS